MTGTSSSPLHPAASPAGVKVVVHPALRPLHLAPSPDRVQGVALGTTATGWPLGSADLDDPLTRLLQHRCQAGAEAARSLDRPAAAARQLAVGEAEQPRVPGGVGAGGGVGEDPAEMGQSPWVNKP